MTSEKQAKKRLDLWLLEKGLASSRTQAQDLIAAGQVFIMNSDGQKTLTKPSLSVESSWEHQIVVGKGDANKFVSRGGLKLEGALKKASLSVKDLNCLDIGISTGGFSDCLLQSGAAFVVGVDVGHGQVHASLLNNSKLIFFEGVNARALSQDLNVTRAKPSAGFDLAVMDVSFISVTLIIPEICALLRPRGLLLSLIKPQFEVGIDGLSKGGIVKDTNKFIEVEKKVKDHCHAQGLKVLDYFSSPILGKDGNNEFFVYAQKN